MEQTKYLIIGGGVAGTTAAETIREKDKEARIIIISDEPYPLYSRVLLTKPNFFMGKIPFDKIWLKDEDWYKEQNIELWAGKSACKLDPQGKIVTLDDGSQLAYEKLMLGVGGKVRKLEVPGADKQGIFYLRTVDDTQAIIDAIKQAKKGVVVGGGIIGFEMAEMLEMTGVETTFVLRMDHYREPLLGIECSEIVEERIKKQGVSIMCSNEVVEVLGDEKITGVKLKNGEQLDCDILIIGIGCIVPFSWLKQAGLETDRGIVANEYLETNLPDVWAAGDGVEFLDIIINEKVMYGNWSNAQKQGERAALNMTGEHEPFKTVTFFQTHGFGVVMTYVGDVRPAADREIIQRGHFGDDIQERMFIKDNKLVGALLINAPQYMGIYSKIIESQVDLAPYKDKLADAHWDIEKIFK